MHRKIIFKSLLFLGIFIRKITRKLDPKYINNYLDREKFRMNIHPDAGCSIKGKLIAGKQIYIGRFANVIVAENSTLTIGDHVCIGDGAHIETCPGQSISIGSGTTLQSRCQLRGDVIIGNSVLLAPNVFISSGTHLYDYVPSLKIREQDKKYREDHGKIYSNPIEIGDDCWLGINVVVTPGKNIDRGCVIGANAVVTKNIAPYSVAAGVPAKVIKKRPT